jgi:hypothetical protein
MNKNTIQLAVAGWFLMLAATAQEQAPANEKAPYKSAFQTNLFAPLRVNQAVNFTWVTMHPTSGDAWTVGGDLIFNRIELGDADQKLLNGFQTQLSGAGFNIYLGYRYYVPQSRFNRGLELEYGYLPFRHKQLLCTESERIVDLCRCNQLENYAFESQNHRLGLSFRLGYSLPVSQRLGLEAYLKLGLMNYFRDGFQDQGAHIDCDGQRVPLNQDFLGGFRLSNLVEFNAAVPTIQRTLIAQIGFNFQFQ